jgi:hypothetical protein
MTSPTQQILLRQTTKRAALSRRGDQARPRIPKFHRAKTNAGMGSLYRSQHELLPLFKKSNAPHVNNIDLGKRGRWRSNMWNYAGASSFGSDARRGLQDHPTVKPTAMLEDVLLDLTNRGDIVLDPFLGSGPMSGPPMTQISAVIVRGETGLGSRIRCSCYGPCASASGRASGRLALRCPRSAVLAARVAMRSPVTLRVSQINHAP